MHFFCSVLLHLLLFLQEIDQIGSNYHTIGSGSNLSLFRLHFCSSWLCSVLGKACFMVLSQDRITYLDLLCSRGETLELKRKEKIIKIQC